MDDDAIAVIQQAERIIYRAAWRVLEEAALDALAGTPGLRRARLEPRSEVIQLVTCDGEHLGHIRRDLAAQPGNTWVAVPRTAGRPAGLYRSAQEAAEALARACGKLSPRIPGRQET
jgi:hypothetical protein